MGKRGTHCDGRFKNRPKRSFFLSACFVYTFYIRFTSLTFLPTHDGGGGGGACAVWQRHIHAFVIFVSCLNFDRELIYR